MDLKGKNCQCDSYYGVEDVLPLPNDWRRRFRPPECTCFFNSEEAAAAPRNAFEGACDPLAIEAIGMLRPEEKDEILMQMHKRIRQLTGRVKDVTSFSENRICSLQRMHEVTLREHAACEHRLREELDHWQCHHPKVAELQHDNTRLREQRDLHKREYMVALRKLARRPDKYGQEKDLAGRINGRRGEGGVKGKR